MKHVFFSVVIITCVLVCGSTRGESAREILDASGVKAGLIVHVGCGDGAVTASLAVNENCVVQGLDTSEANVAAARRRLRVDGGPPHSQAPCPFQA